MIVFPIYYSCLVALNISFIRLTAELEFMIDAPAFMTCLLAILIATLSPSRAPYVDAKSTSTKLTIVTNTYVWTPASPSTTPRSDLRSTSTTASLSMSSSTRGRIILPLDPRLDRLQSVYASAWPHSKFPSPASRLSHNLYKNPYEL